MRHTFQLGVGSKCKVCQRAFIDHSSQATCEACGNKSECNVVGTPREFPIYRKDDEGNNYIADHGVTGVMLLCKSCEDKEQIAIVASEVEIPEDPTRERIVNLLNALDKELPLDSRAYFNAEITSIVEVEQKLASEISDADKLQFKLAEIVENRLNKFKRNLFEVKRMELELKVNMVADQRYLNKLVPQLREEERAKFKDYDITYKPPTASPTSKPSGPRMSAQDKAIESFAKMMGISVEQARVALNKGIATTIKCTCSETPGLCKVHPKGN